ncbi:histidine phosphatase family protein [Cellulomonas hominis]
MVTLYLVRHGRTVYNSEHLLQGWCDSPLTDAGRDGVRVTAGHLSGHTFAAAYASPSGRTVDTAHEILRHHPGTTLSTDPDLREFSFGDFEATPESELWERYDPYSLFGGVLDGTFAGLPGGEPSGQYLGRVAAAFDRIERAHPDGSDILVVSHGLTLTAYLTMVGYRGMGALPNASLSTVTVAADGTRTIIATGLDIAGQGVPAIDPPARLAPGAATAPPLVGDAV